MKLKVGDLAPDFKLQYFDGHELKDVSLSQYHGKKNVVEADRLLTASELESRVYAYFACSPESRLAKPEKVA